jgi:hypothetical protein
MSTRAAVVIGLSVVLATCIVTFGARPTPPPATPPAYPEMSFESGSITALSGSTGSAIPAATNTFDGPFRVTVTDHFLIVRKPGDQGKEVVYYIPRERVVWATGITAGNTGNTAGK